MSTVGQLPQIKPSEAMAKIREGALAVDIRSQAEYRGGHIGGALSLPPEQQRDKLPADKGVQLIDKQSRKGAEGLNIGFLHPKSTIGVLTELCDHRDVK